MTNKRSILIVEDLPNWQEVLVELLRNEYQIQLANSVEEAYLLLDTNIFDLVILDLRLEDENSHNIEGIPILQRIKERNSETAVIILTAFLDSIGSEIFEKYKPNDVFQKPPEIKKFKKRVRELIDIKLMQ